MQADVLLIGAGAAGLMAARELSANGKKVIVLEARDHIGGRAYTVIETGFSQPIESGAEFIHGNLELTLHLLKEAHIKTNPAGGEAWRSKEGRLVQEDDFMTDADALMQALKTQKEESSVDDFLTKHFNNERYGDLKKSVRGYVEGYYAGEPNRASVLALKEEWEREDEPQYRVQGGYIKLMQALYDNCIANGVVFHFSAPVKSIAWAFEKVEATTINNSVFESKKIIITVPVSVLQNEQAAGFIQFQPQLTSQFEALKKLGYGGVIKILIEFKIAFWETDFNLKSLGFLFSDEAIPIWWTQHPVKSPLLVGWCAGPNTNALKANTDTELFQEAIQSLAYIFNLPLVEIENNVAAWKVYNWSAEPFTAGGYSYVTTTTKEALHLLNQAVEDTIYFAGEALYDDINVGTVEAALQSGKQTAQKLLASKK